MEVLALIFCILVYEFIRYQITKDKNAIAIYAKDCSECPFFSKVASPSEVDFKCTLDRRVEQSLYQLKKNCIVSEKSIVITLKKQ